MVYKGINLLIPYLRRSRCEIIYPIRKSNKPPYIYWKVLVVVGIALLIGALIATPYATYVSYRPAYIEGKTITLSNSSFKIPQKNPINLLISFKQYVTHLKISINGERCSGLEGSVTVIGSHKTYPIYCGRTALFKAPGVEIFTLSLNKRPGSAGKLLLTYNYTVYEVLNPYSHLAYLGLFLSLIGASAGVLGVVLMIKKKILEKAEEKYLK